MSEKLIEMAEQKFEEQFERMKEELLQQNQASLDHTLAKLEECRNALRDNLQILSSPTAPVDLSDLYLRANGRVWVSKKIGVLYNIWMNHMGDTILSLEDIKGMYRFVVIAIPEEVKPDKEGRVQDDYGHTFDYRQLTGESGS